MKVNQNRTKQKLESNKSRARELKINTCVNLCIYVLCHIALFFFSGCNSGNGYAKLKSQINNLKEENAQLTKQIAQVNEENSQLNSR